MNNNRLDRRFAALKAANRPGLVAFLSSGDPDHQTAGQLLNALPAAGADVIELGMPFTDPMADGPAIQASALRALRGGVTMARTLKLVSQFRLQERETPLVLMGYYNPIHAYGLAKFCQDAARVGVDGLIIVDLPPEEDAELRLAAKDNNIHVIRLATPTTDDQRLPQVLEGAGGFLYYVSITGITGAAAPDPVAVAANVARIKKHTDLPVAVGFGIRTGAQAAAIGAFADAAVVGSAIVSAIAEKLDKDGRAQPGLVNHVTALVQDIAKGLKQTRDAA